MDTLKVNNIVSVLDVRQLEFMEVKHVAQDYRCAMQNMTLYLTVHPLICAVLFPLFHVGSKQP